MQPIYIYEKVAAPKKIHKQTKNPPDFFWLVYKNVYFGDLHMLLINLRVSPSL